MEDFEEIECMGEDCHWGWVSLDGGAGTCDRCGTLHVTCGDCGATESYPDTGSFTCEYCEEGKWEIWIDKDGCYRVT